MCVCAKLFANIEFFYWIFHFLIIYFQRKKKYCLPSSSSLLIVEFSFFLYWCGCLNQIIITLHASVSNTAYWIHHPSKHPHTYFVGMVLDYGKKTTTEKLLLFFITWESYFSPPPKKKEENGKTLKFTFFFLSLVFDF